MVFVLSFVFVIEVILFLLGYLFIVNHYAELLIYSSHIFSIHLDFHKFFFYTPKNSKNLNLIFHPPLLFLMSKNLSKLFLLSNVFNIYIYYCTYYFNLQMFLINFVFTNSEFLKSYISSLYLVFYIVAF